MASTFRLHFFLAGVVSLSIFAWLVNTIPPKEGSVVSLGVSLLTIICLFFLLSFLKNVRRAIMWSSGVGIILILRAINLHDPLYVVLLIILLGSLELALKNR